jgi:hypothetical protein
MNAYRVIDKGQEHLPMPNRAWFKTRGDAHAYAKERRDEGFIDILIELVDVPTSSDVLISILNGEIPETIAAIRAWKLSKRGGLVELGGEEPAEEPETPAPAPAPDAQAFWDSLNKGRT